MRLTRKRAQGGNGGQRYKSYKKQAQKKVHKNIETVKFSQVNCKAKMESIAQHIYTSIKLENLFQQDQSENCESQ
jgi:hypothetical protein